MAERYEFMDVDFITAGAIGPPGQRTFYLQVQGEGEHVTILVEKGQVSALTRLAQELLAGMGVTVTPDDLDEEAQRLREPVEPVWRAGEISIGVDDLSERFVIAADEIDDGSPEADVDPDRGLGRFWLTKDQLAAFAAYAAYAVEAGARQTCRLCGRPIDPDGHVCPSLNGHGPLTV